MIEEPCGPVAAYRWMVFGGTRWTEVIAADEEDARTLGLVRLNATQHTDVRVRRLRPSDEERNASWKATADQLQLSTAKWPR